MDILLDIKDATLVLQNNVILENIDLRIKQGDFVYIIGKVGTGKTTLLKSIYGTIPIKKGQIFFDHKNVGLIKQKEMYLHRRKIGMIFQEFHLLEDRSVFQNLEFVLKATGWTDKKTIENHINTTLEWCNIESLRNKFPNELSGGEKNIASISRAIINDPKLILADEPTQNLDPETATSQLELLNRINQTGTTIIMSTHNHSLINKYPKTTYKCKDKKFTLL
ncbi:ATP-binding cassette domain-containing protein [Halosquirtibacter laminarini]|uniref:ATP-binding cassette domain-containing protein n=1 Tax=Halosquirtibacter laminarini TaxID=3374600 RepID=A0AC61NCB1_9BACT|nr:ATP-binding cassette domain-containing protein [Prolixibacteraceae bacterium]